MSLRAIMEERRQRIVYLLRAWQFAVKREPFRSYQVERVRLEVIASLDAWEMFAVSAGGPAALSVVASRAHNVARLWCDALAYDAWFAGRKVHDAASV